jgi:hypothetical protein
MGRGRGILNKSRHNAIKQQRDREREIWTQKYCDHNCPKKELLHNREQRDRDKDCHRYSLVARYSPPTVGRTQSTRNKQKETEREGLRLQLLRGNYPRKGHLYRIEQRATQTERQPVP